MIDRLAAWSGRPVSRETFAQIEHYVALLHEESTRQNIISESTIHNVWERHIFDSAQLTVFEPRAGASWVDIGAGAGLPGVVVALLVEGPVTLIEPRRLRAEFLQHAIAELDLAGRVEVIASNVQRVTGTYDVITARALARLDRLLDLSTHLSTKNSLWVLPKGRSARSELEAAHLSWQCDAVLEPSRTDPDSEILLLRSVRPKGSR